MVDTFKLLFNEKPTLILLSLLNSNVSQYPFLLSKNINCMYCHAVNVLNYLEDSNLVKFKKEGRIKIVELTENGKKLANYLQQINNLLKEIEKKNLNNKNGIKKS